MKKVRKFFIKSIFWTTLIISSIITIIKLLIPHNYQFIEPISIYWSILSAVIFIYWFILAPSIWEYKESEKLINEIKTSLLNIRDDVIYFKMLKDNYDLEKYNFILSKIILDFYYKIVDSKDNYDENDFLELNKINLEWEKSWITANHIIRMKQELSIIRKSFWRIIEIKEKDSLPFIIHQLKNFITFMVIITLLFLNIWDSKDIVAQIQESVMLFLISFLYIYLSFIISYFDNPFDKRKFTWFIDLSFLLDFTKNKN